MFNMRIKVCFSKYTFAYCTPKGSKLSFADNSTTQQFYLSYRIVRAMYKDNRKYLYRMNEISREKLRERYGRGDIQSSVIIVADSRADRDANSALTLTDFEKEFFRLSPVKNM